MSMGCFTRFAVDDALPFDVSSRRMELLREDLKTVDSRIFNEALQGTRRRNKNRIRRGNKDVGGTLTMNPTPAELAWWFPKILGAAPVGNAYALAETIPEFVALIDKVGQTHCWTGCKVARAVFQANSGGGLIMVLTIIGKEEEAPGSIAFPAIQIDEEPPFVFSDADGGLSLDSSTFEMDRLQVVIDNLPNPRRNNSRTLTSIKAGDREILLGLQTPYEAAEVALFNSLTSTDDDIPGSIVFTNGGYSLTFDFPFLAPLLETPVVGGKEEIVLPHNFSAYGDNTTPELAVTLDSNPL